MHRAAAAIAVALAALAGALLAMRATVEPYGGPLLLIQAFEAVVIGGIGSLWGTLAGGIALGVAQSLGALVSPQGFQLAGHLLFLAVLGAAAVAPASATAGLPGAARRWRRPFAQEGVRHDAPSIGRSALGSPPSRSRACAAALRGRRVGGRQGSPRCSSTCCWRVTWNLMAGYAGLVSVGQQAFFGLGGYFALRLVDGGLAGLSRADRRRGRARRWSPGGCRSSCCG